MFNISVKKALKEMPKAAIKSIYDELQQLHSKGVWKGVKPTFKHKKKVIKSFLFLKEKFDSAGAFVKLKSRLVAGGHMQDTSELLYEQVHSPTASLAHVFMIASLAARDHRHVKTSTSLAHTSMPTSLVMECSWRSIERSQTAS